MLLMWEWMYGEWVLRSYKHSPYNGGYVRFSTYFLSPYGPPYRYRVWDRANKDWERWALPHVDNIEEAKACLAVAMRLA
jgi:hypothetical protein